MTAVNVTQIEAFRETVHTFRLNIFSKIFLNVNGGVKRVQIIRVYFKFADQIQVAKECSSTILQPYTDTMAEKCPNMEFLLVRIFPHFD